MTTAERQAQMLDADQVDEVQATMDLLQDLEPDQKRAVARKLMREADASEEPTHRIAYDRMISPQYLAGCPGRLGSWRSRERVEFLPQPGTRAYAKGRTWRVTRGIVEAIA
jgi:hypothetical protein